MNPYLKENLTNWVSEYAASDMVESFSKEMRSAGGFLLQELLLAVVEEAGDIEDVSEKALGEKLMTLSHQYDLKPAVMEALPAYCATFFEDLEAKGRYGHGESMSLFLKTFGGRLGAQTVRRPGAKIGRNDPCPCGSGKKFKKCCQQSS